MNFTHTTTRRWIERGSLMLAGATLLGAAAGANSGDAELLEQPAALPTTLTQPTNLSSLREALQGGTFWANFRYRYENVDQKPLAREANASTLRTRLGYKSGDWKGFTGVLEFSDVVNIGAGERNYNPAPGTASIYPVVADPVGAQMNQAYVNYEATAGNLRFGRQRLKIDNDRFVGNVGWRQTEQNYDAITYMKTFEAGLRVIYGYVANINTITQGNLKTDTHLLNVSQNWDNIGRLTFYGYRLDVDAAPGLNAFTYGARFAGEHNSGDWGLLYELEYAQQVETADNPMELDANYSHAALGGKVQGAALKVGLEVLEGNADPLQNRAFQTPLATKHGFNGWADMFLTTPATGLEDLYVDLSYKMDDWKAGIVYHMFEPEQSAAFDYGDELDIIAQYNIAKDLTVGVKFADFEGDDTVGNTFQDRTKMWVWLAYAF